MAIFVKTYSGEYYRGRLIKKLNKVVPQVIVSAGKSSISNGNTKYAREIVAIYNSNLRNCKLDESKL